MLRQPCSQGKDFVSDVFYLCEFFSLWKPISPVQLLLGNDWSERTRVTGATPGQHKEPQGWAKAPRSALGTPETPGAGRLASCPH